MLSAQILKPEFSRSAPKSFLEQCLIWNEAEDKGRFLASNIPELVTMSARPKIGEKQMNCWRAGRDGGA